MSTITDSVLADKVQLSAVCCLMSTGLLHFVRCLLFAGYTCCLLFALGCLLSAACLLLSAVRCLLSAVYCLSFVSHLPSLFCLSKVVERSPNKKSSKKDKKEKSSKKDKKDRPKTPNGAPQEPTHSEVDIF
jgi:hypothetical protein